jgi:2-haloacid dehalogenase
VSSRPSCSITTSPFPQTYLGAAALLGLGPGEVMMVAAHVDDLIAARKSGLRTAYVHRPHEFGPRAQPLPKTRFDVAAQDFLDLADKLGV